MKKIKLCLMIAASAILLTACGNNKKEPIIVEPESIGTETANSENLGSTDSTGLITEDDTLPPAEGMLRSRLTNEWVDADVANTRPIAVITPNEKECFPQYGISNASILYEANVEGRMTRMLAIYEDWENLDKIGNLRSLRLYYGFWALEWDAFIVHAGGPYFINDLIDQSNTQNINALLGGDSSGFFLDNSRQRPHNTYASGENLKKVIDKKGYSLSYRGLADDNHYKFTSKANPNTLSQYTNAVDASYIDMSSCYPLTRVYFKYDESDGLYYRYQHVSGTSDGPHMDNATGKQLSFKNIIIQNTKHEVLDNNGYLAFQCHDNTRDGWYFTNGKGIHVTWKKGSDYAATRYYDDNGDEIIMNTGKTMVCIVEDGDQFSYK